MKTGFLLLIFLSVTCVSCTDNRPYRNGRDYSSNQKNESDSQLNRRVKQAISDDNSLSKRARLVYVNTNDGVVSLTGTVPDQETYYYIEQKVRNISGVRAVSNEMTISGK